MGNSKKSTGKKSNLLELINSFNKISEYKIKIISQWYFYTLDMNNEHEIKKNPIIIA